jgi:hypothetical protein
MTGTEVDSNNILTSVNVTNPLIFATNAVAK